MKILLVANTGWYLYNFRLNLSRELRRAGAEVVFVCPRDRYVPLLEKNGFVCLPWNIARSSMHPLRELSAVWQLIQIYRRERPALVHHFTIKSILYGTLAAKWARVGRAINAVTGLGHMYLSRGLKTRLARPLIHRWYSWSLTAAGVRPIFQNSDDLDELARRTPLLAKRAVLSRGSGVDLARFSPQPATGGLSELPPQRQQLPSSGSSHGAPLEPATGGLSELPLQRRQLPSSGSSHGAPLEPATGGLLKRSLHSANAGSSGKGPTDSQGAPLETGLHKAPREPGEGATNDDARMPHAPRLSRLVMGQTPRRPCVLFAGRLIRQKGIFEFVEAARIIHERGVPARFLVCGETDPGNPSGVDAALCRRWHDEGAVELMGHVEGIEEVIRQSAVVVLPSYREGTPRILLEAAAMGKPIVATDVPGCREVVVHGANGFLVPPQNPGELAAKIEMILADRELRDAMGRAGRRRAVRHFDERNVIRDTLQVYAELLGPRALRLGGSLDLFPARCRVREINGEYQRTNVK